MKKSILFESLFKWKFVNFSSKEEYINVDGFFCQAFGPRKNNPGFSNQFLAGCIIQEYKKNPKPLIIQKECADAFPSNIKIDKIISKHEVYGKYLDSFEVSRQCYEYCKKNNLKTLLVFAHPDHIWRVVKTLEKIGFNNIVVADTRGTPYDWHSIQIWTKAKFIFLLREFFVRLLYLFKKKI